METKRHYRPEKVKKYEARWYVEKWLKCRFFTTEAEREQFIDEFQEQLSQNGTNLLLGFDPAKMRRWQEASRLAPDADPVEVMRFWLASNRPNLTPKPFADAIPAYQTPYKAFNTYFVYSNSFDLNGMMAAMTEEAKIAFFEGEVPSASEATAIGQAIQQEGHTASVIESFYYTDDSTNPEIRATISSIHNQLKGTELLIIKYVDTPSGWKISDQEIWLPVTVLGELYWFFVIFNGGR